MCSSGVKRDIVHDGLNAMCGMHDEMDFVDYLKMKIKRIVHPKHPFTHTHVVPNQSVHLSTYHLFTERTPRFLEIMINMCALMFLRYLNMLLLFN